MKGRLEIRPVRIEDLREIYLRGREFLAPHRSPSRQAWNETNLADALVGDPGLSLVATIKKKIVGFLIASLEQEGALQTATIRWLCADPSGPAGLTDRLLREYISMITERRIDKIMITLPEDHAEIIEYYRNFGFTESNRFIIMENFSPKRS